MKKRNIKEITKTVTLVHGIYIHETYNVVSLTRTKIK